MNIPSNTYKAVGENHKHLRVTTHDDGSYSGFFISDEDEWIQFDSVARHTQFMKPHHLSSIGKGSHLLLWSAVKSDASKKEFPSGNTLPFSPPQPPCPSSLHKYTTTIAASVGFYNSIGRSIKQTINFMAAAIMGVNIFFEQDINLHVTIDNAIVYTSSGSVVWNSKTDEPQCNSRLVLNFRDNWPKDVPQCCGMSNGGILFHNCILNNPGVSSGAVCNDDLPQSTILRHLDPYETRRYIGQLISLSFGVPFDTNGIMSGVSPTRDIRYDRFSRVSQTAMCQAMAPLLGSTCLKTYS
mmetsp:Transcript_29678/g.33078  ORF Transcript_29678/g.33078 Transcript_29678/m.33078 type:complete len:297 (+) Transcript_29678:340-1230(+)